MGIIWSLWGERTNHRTVPAALPWLPSNELQQEGLPMVSTSHKVSRCWQHSPPAPCKGSVSAYKAILMLAKPYPFACPVKRQSIMRGGCIRKQAQVFLSMRLERLGASGTPHPPHSTAGIMWHWTPCDTCPSLPPTLLRIFFQRTVIFLPVIILQIHWMKFCL